MSKGEGRRLKVWTWGGRDPVSLHDLEFVTAVFAKGDLQAASARLRLPKPNFGDYALVKPNDPRFDVAAATQGRVLFRDIESGEQWLDEDHLASLRTTSTATHLQAGRVVPPLHRPQQ